MSSNIQLKVKASTNTYTSVYPTSDGDVVNRQGRVIDSLDGDNLTEVIQDIANKYINPLGSQWNKMLSSLGFAAVGGCDDFVFGGVVTSSRLQPYVSFDGGINWTKGSSTYALGNTNVKDIECIPTGGEYAFRVKILQGSSSSSSVLTLKVKKDGTITNDGNNVTISTGLSGLSRSKDKFIAWGSSGNIYTCDFSSNTWTSNAVSFPSNVSQVVYSKRLNKPFGVTSDGKIAYPVNVNTTASWTSVALGSEIWTSGDICNAIDGVACLVGNSSGSKLYYKSTIADNVYTLPTLSNDTWGYVVGGDNVVLVISTKGVVCGLVNGSWVTSSSGLFSLATQLNGTISDARFIRLQDEIIGNIKLSGGSGYDTYVAPLLSYK